MSLVQERLHDNQGEAFAAMLVAGRWSLVRMRSGTHQSPAVPVRPDAMTSPSALIDAVINSHRGKQS